MARTNWPIVGLGALLLFGGSITPIPEDVVTTPLALGLIAYGAGYV